MNRIRLFLLVSIIGLVSNGERDTAAEDLSAQAIVAQAVARAEEQHDRQADIGFESLVSMSIQSLDTAGKATESDLTHYRQYPLNGALYEELITKDGKSLNAREKKTEEKNRKKFIQDVEKRKQRGLHPQPDKRPGIRFGDRLMQRYRYQMLRTEEADGHPCWVIGFEPKEGKLPVDEMMDHALNECTGALWVAKEDYGLVRLDFVMRKPFKYWAGLLAVIRNTEGRLDFKRVEPNIWLPVHFDLKLDLNVMMVKDIRRLITRKWTNYKRI